MEISVIIPTYKPSEYLNDCLQSLDNQIYKDFEVIIVLIGCCEPYLSWIEDVCSEKYPHLNVSSH